MLLDPAFTLPLTDPFAPLEMLDEMEHVAPLHVGVVSSDIEPLVLLLLTVPLISAAAAAAGKAKIDNM